jgi:hypothetical protein
MSQDPIDPNNSVNSPAPPQQYQQGQGGTGGQQSVPAYQPYTLTFPTGYMGIPVTSSGNIIFTISAGTSPASEEDEAIEMEADEGEGCTCTKCKNFNEYAEPNQEDGTFICYPCRRGW